MTLDEISYKLARPRSEENVKDIISKMKSKQPEHIHRESEISCPNGDCGHKLKKTEKGTLKCTGDKCGKEFIMVDKEADAYCVECGLPINSKDKDKIDACPKCGSHKADYYKK